MHPVNDLWTWCSRNSHSQGDILNPQGRQLESKGVSGSYFVGVLPCQLSKGQVLVVKGVVIEGVHMYPINIVHREYKCYSAGSFSSAGSCSVLNIVLFYRKHEVTLPTFSLIEMVLTFLFLDFNL